MLVFQRETESRPEARSEFAAISKPLIMRGFPRTHFGNSPAFDNSDGNKKIQE
jgi:hypothetical protein